MRRAGYPNETMDEFAARLRGLRLSTEAVDSRGKNWANTTWSFLPEQGDTEYDVW